MFKASCIRHIPDEVYRNEEDLEELQAALKGLCWIPFGFQLQPIGSDGGEICLHRSEVGKPILLDVTPDATIPSEPAEVRFAVIPHGPFTLPEGYRLGSTVVYLYYNGQHGTRPLQLRLPHWYGGVDHVKDGLSFAMAPLTLKERESVYRFELLEGGRFAEQRQCGVLQISSQCALLAVVFKVEAPCLYYASLWTYQVAAADEFPDEIREKVAITYADPVWIEVGINHYAVERII